MEDLADIMFPEYEFSWDNDDTRTTVDEDAFSEELDFEERRAIISEVLVPQGRADEECTVTLEGYDQMN